MLPIAPGTSLTLPSSLDVSLHSVQIFTPLVEKCKRLNRAMRIGTNHGSLSARILSYYGDTPRGMVESAFEFADICRCPLSGPSAGCASTSCSRLSTMLSDEMLKCFRPASDLLQRSEVGPKQPDGNPCRVLTWPIHWVLAHACFGVCMMGVSPNLACV